MAELSWTQSRGNQSCKSLNDSMMYQLCQSMLRFLILSFQFLCKGFFFLFHFLRVDLFT